jgi:competence protein ComEA
MVRLVTFAVVAAAAAIAAVFALVQLWDARSAPPIVIEDPRPNATIVVAVEGAVVSPGVYAVRGDARLKDLLDAAGGARADADLTGVNQAARLVDEQRVVVPAKPPTVETPASPTGPSVPVGTTPPGAKININTASAAELDTLPRIGPVLAQRIVEYRTAQGPFRSVDELALIDGISLATVDAIRPLVTV